MKQPKSMTQCNCKAFDRHFAEFQHEEHKIVTFKDKGISEYQYTNKSSNHLAKYVIDGKLIADAGAKCDFLLLNCEQKQSYFIELKGSDIIRAIEQIDRSIDLLKPNLTDFAFFARIVLTKVSTIDSKSTKLVKLEKKLKSLKGNLKKQTKLLQEAV